MKIEHDPSYAIISAMLSKSGAEVSSAYLCDKVAMHAFRHGTDLILSVEGEGCVRVDSETALGSYEDLCMSLIVAGIMSPTLELLASNIKQAVKDMEVILSNKKVAVVNSPILINTNNQCYDNQESNKESSNQGSGEVTCEEGSCIKTVSHKNTYKKAPRFYPSEKGRIGKTRRRGKKSIITFERRFCQRV